MKNLRKSVKDRRQGERRQNAHDARPESEKGMVGEQRSGKDRRNNVRDRRMHDQFALESFSA